MGENQTLDNQEIFVYFHIWIQKALKHLKFLIKVLKN
jgi:hypothetical protein